MTPSWHKHQHDRIQADDVIEMIRKLISEQKFDEAERTIEYHPYMGSVYNEYGKSMFETLYAELSKAIDETKKL